MTNLAMGANAPIASPELVLDVHLPQGKLIDVSALLLYPGGKVRSDGDMCFFNQLSIASGAISLTTNDSMQSFSIDFARVDNEVEKIVVNATLENGQFSAVDDLKITTSNGVDMLVETAGRTEAALILCEIYKRNDQWKIRNVSQGFDGGLQALAEHFGVEVDAPADPVPTPAPPASASNSASSPAPSASSSPPDSASGSPVSSPTGAPSSTASNSDASSASSSTSSSASGSSSTSSSSSSPATSSTAPAFFNRLKQTAVLAGSKLSTEASRFRNRTFMEAVVNGCVLVAAADGSIDASEKQKMAGFIERSDELKHFDVGQVISVFQSAADAYESDNVLGKAIALEKIRKVKANEDQARLLVRVVSAIGAADGEFDTQEKQMVSEIARALGLDPTDFNV